MYETSPVLLFPGNPKPALWYLSDVFPWCCAGIAFYRSMGNDGRPRFHCTRLWFLIGSSRYDSTSQSSGQKQPRRECALYPDRKG